MNELVSIIMSTYNESLEMLDISIKSIINQTYKNIQFIIINDNPNRKEMDEFLEQKSKEYSDIIIYIRNKCNIGLVESLNKGIKRANGTYIARMDADDISFPDRIEKQINFLKENLCDIVGASVKTINEQNQIIGEIKVPIIHDNIVRFYNYGSCLLHPTWLVKREVFFELRGYRNIYACEDYDFITRAIRKGYRLGNVPEFLLKYRVRNTGISVSAEAQQKLVMYYIIKNQKNINELKEEDFCEYLESKRYKNNLSMMNKFIVKKNKLKSNKNIMNILWTIITLITNKYLYIHFIMLVKNRKRNKFTF